MTAALLGAHNIGKKHGKISGFSGYWFPMTTHFHFENSYYKSLFNKGFVNQEVTEEWKGYKTGKVQWQHGMESMHWHYVAGMWTAFLETDMCLAVKLDKTA